jgi:signal transduction histidine kinase
VDAKLESHPLSPTDLADLRTLIHAQVRDRLQLDWAVALNEPVPLPATPVRQILLNLLLNACHAAEKRVALRLDTQADGLLLQIENDGRTIPPKRLEHLYEPFVEEEGEGRGLGLWIVYQLVRQLDGRIDVTSEHGLTRFTLFLPIKRS